MKKLSNIHPGEVLLEEFLKQMAISQNALARALEVPPRRVNEIVPGKRRITADTALRLAAFFGTSEGFWLGLQAACDLELDLEVARGGIGKALLRVEPARAEYGVSGLGRVADSHIGWKANTGADFQPFASCCK